MGRFEKEEYMKKIVKKGWVGKDDKIKIVDPKISCVPYTFPEIFARIESKDTWDTRDWPPRRVIVTIEYED